MSCLRGLWKAMVILGVFLALFGIVFALQGYGLVGPSSSPMYNSQTWVDTGAGIAIVGLIVFIVGIFILSSNVKKSKKVSSKPNASLNSA